MKETEYAYSVAYVRTLENKLLTKSDLDALINAKTAEEAMKMLADKGYGDGRAKPTDIEYVLKDEFEKTLTNVREACPEGSPVDLILYKNDFQNLKTILKATHSSVSWESLMLTPYTVEPQIIADAVVQGKISELPELMREPALKAYDILVKTGDGQLLEVVLDCSALSAMTKRAIESGSDYLEGYAKLMCDIVNMKTAIRGSKAGIDRRMCDFAIVPYGTFDKNELAQSVEEGTAAVYAYLEKKGYNAAAETAKKSISDFEKLCDNMLIDYMKNYKNKAFGFEPIFGYLNAKQTELQSLRIIISGHINKIPKSVVEGRLRDLYV